jgi:hypothetical protein
MRFVSHGECVEAQVATGVEQSGQLRDAAPADPSGVWEMPAGRIGSLQILYGIDSRRDHTESTRDELSRSHLVGRIGAQPIQ